jgi:hypothetical protein
MNHLKNPGKQDNLGVALRLARETFAKRPKERLADEAGVTDLGGGGFELEILGSRVRYDPRNGAFSAVSGAGLNLRQEIILLHYLCQAHGTELTGQIVSFGQIPGAGFYDPVFNGRIRGRTAGTFGGAFAAFEKAALALGATRAEMGDLSMTVPAVPRVPITIVLWRGDAELPASSNFIFDSSISAYLCVEDIVVLSEELVSRLTKLAFPAPARSR